MCGICGKLTLDQAYAVDAGLIRKMTGIIRHRGPDDEGYYDSPQIGLGHRRLSIIDLATGKQPITNEDGSLWVVFNGEIYNYAELRETLISSGHVFKTRTDTEVIVHLYEEHGEDFLSKLRGMFAIALWDEKEKVLILARDRVGIKPLYYCVTDKALLFASEIKSILVDESVDRVVNPGGIDTFLTYYYMPGNETLFKNIYKLSPGHYLVARKGRVEIKQYWDLNFCEQPGRVSFSDARDQVVELLRETVRGHMMTDVPLGFLLSGGVDSTALLSFAAKETNMGISTFTIGFEGNNFADERVYARLAAKEFGTRHYDMTMGATNFLDFLPKFVWHMEEPVCEPPAIALYYISRLAKEHVKVLISGEGGDEAFAGYQNYRNTVWLERLKRFAPRRHRALSFFLSRAGVFGPFKRLSKYAPLVNVPLERYYYSRTATPYSFFNLNYSDLYTPTFKEEIDKAHSTWIALSLFENVRDCHDLNKMLYVDTKTWLPDDLLVKADKMTMANSLELRVPFLDHKVLEFAASLPPEFKLKGIETKYILKKAFKEKVPIEILKRKKTGLPVPYAHWMANDLREWVRDVLFDRKTLERGYFNKKAVEGILNNSEKLPKEVFSLLTLELWHRAFIDGAFTGMQ